MSELREAIEHGVTFMITPVPDNSNITIEVDVDAILDAVLAALPEDPKYPDIKENPELFQENICRYQGYTNALEQVRVILESAKSEVKK